MQRLAAIFIVTCMVLIAGGLGVALYLGAGLSGAEAAVSGLIVLSALALYNAIVARLRDREELGGQIAGLSRGIADLARQVGDLGRRTVALESRSDAVVDRIRNATAPLATEVADLGGLVRQLAESVAHHDSALARTSAPPAPKAAPIAEAAPAIDPFDFEPAVPPAQSNRLLFDHMTAVIRGALDANRVDLYLQPIVTLPQRKVRYDGALTRLRTEEGRTIEPAEFLEAAETSGLIARLDHVLLTRCVQVLRRLQQKNRDIGLFCNLSAVTLNDPQFFPQMSQYMDANRVLAPALVIEFKQSVWRAMGPLEIEALAALREAGFRFGMDQVTDLRFEPRDLADRGIRFVKVPAAMLLGRGGETASDIHVADLSGLLARYSVNLVADSIESEIEVVDLLDYELKFGQGNLFSVPRPVRADALQAGPDATASPAADAVKDKPPEAPAIPPAAAAI